MIKGFGALCDWECLLDPFWTELPFAEGEVDENVNEAIVALLFGFPPHQRPKKQQFVPESGTDKYSASMLIETVDGEYLIGRHFTRETAEIFRLQEQQIFSLSPLVLMDLLYKEIGLLNPLDFEVVSVYRSKQLFLDQNAPLVREHIQKLILNPKLNEIMVKTVNEEKMKQNREELAELDTLLLKLEQWETDWQRLTAEEQKLAAYESFLSQDGEDLLALSARDYTAATLETSFYERQLREEAETRRILEQEVDTLRRKIAAFDPDFYSSETEQKVNRLLQKRAELNQLLQKEEVALEQLGRKGFRLRLGQKEKEAEIEQRIGSLLHRLDQLREAIRLILKNKKPEEFLQEKALLEHYRSDLTRLDRPSLLKQNDRLPQEELGRARQKEEKLRQERERLLALTGQEELETVHTKVKKLGMIKKERMTIEAGLSRFLNAVDKATLEEARDYLLEEKRQRETQIKAEENAVMVDDPDLCALFTLYQDAGRMLSVLTEEEDLGLMPYLDGNRLRFKVITTEGPRPVEEVSFPFPHPEVPDLAFRLALAKAVGSKGQPMLLFDDFSSWLTPQMKEDLRQVLLEWFSEGQIIFRVK